MNFAHNCRRRSNCSGSGWVAILMGRLLIAWSAIALLLLLTRAVKAAPMLESLPGSPNDLYLDCTTIPWDATDDQIMQTWQVVKDYYSPFNVNVRTTKPLVDKPNVAWLLMGGPLRDGLLGYAGLNNWRLGTLAGPALAGYVFADGMNDNPLECGEVAAHELGHLLGLPHEDSGLMYYALIPDPPPQWTAFDIAYLGNPGVLGFAPVPEPHLLLLAGLIFVLSQRQRRQSQPRPSCSGTSRMPSMRTNKPARALRAASSQFGASKYAESLKPSFCHVGCNRMPSILKRMELP